jgi:hypothetical protein
MNTLKAIDTIPMSKDLAIFSFSELLSSFFALAPFMIVGYYDRLVVEEYALQPPVRAGNDTYLLPEPGEDKVKDPGKNKQGYQGADMLQGSIGDVSNKGITANQISEKYIGNEEGDQKKYTPFCYSFSDFLCVPALPVEPYLCSAIAINPEFNSSENHFHKNSLGAHPAAENSSESHCKKSDEYNPGDHRDHKEVKILRPERISKDVEPPFKYIKHQKLIPVDLYKWSCKQKQQQSVAHPFAVFVKFTGGFFGEYPGTFAFFIDSPYGITETFIVCHAGKS